MAIGKSIVDVLKSITGKNVETIADGLEEALSGGSGGGGVLIVNCTIDTQTEVGTLDKTWQEINDADVAVIKCVGVDEVTGAVFVSRDFVLGTEKNELDSEYRVICVNEQNVYMTSSADGYPSNGGGDSGEPST